MSSHEVLVIGAGPAGLAAALQLERYGVDTLTLEREAVGGLLRNANLVENYPGFPGGLPGCELVSRIHEQVRQVGVRIQSADVLDLCFEADLFQARTAASTFFAPFAVLATGTRPKTLPNLHMPAGLEEHLLYEVLPLRPISGKHILIVGAGDLAFDFALNLTPRNRVTILNRSNTRRCLPLLWERASHIPEIDYWESASIAAVHPGDSAPLQVTVSRAGASQSIPADTILGAIGRQGDLSCLSPSLLAQAESLQTSGRLFLAGDVHNGIYRQASIAAGEGVLTAMKIYENLRG